VSVDRVLQLKLIADVSDINGKMTSVTQQTSKLGSAFGTLTSFAGPVALNAAITGIAMLTDGLQGGVEDARKFNDAAAGLAGTLAPLGIAAGAAQLLAEKAAAAGSALGFADDDQVVRGLQAFAEQTQSAATAQLLLGAAMDLARLKGIPLEEAVGKVQAIYKGSSRTLAEFGIAGVSGMAAVNAALGDNLGYAATWAGTTQGQYATTAAVLDDAFQTAGTAITQVLDSVIIPALAELLPIIGNLWATWQPVLAELGTKFGEIIGKMLEVWNKLQPAIQTFADFVAPLLANIGVWVETAFGIVTGVLDAIIALLNGDVTGAFNALGGVVTTITDGIMTAFGNVLAFFLGAVEAFGSLATNIGTAIYDGIAQGINAVVGVVRDVVNKIIGALNSINDFAWERQGFEVNTIAGNFFVGVGAGSIQMWPDIPMLAKGGIVNSPTLALIGEAGPEAVVPLSGGGGMGTTINVNITAGVGDPVAIGDAVIKALRAYTGRRGNGDLRVLVGR
jgi:hypothetical protein